MSADKLLNALQAFYATISQIDNQVIIGKDNTPKFILNFDIPSQDRTVTIPDIGVDAKILFNINPTVVDSIKTDSLSFDLINTNATNVNFAGSANTLAVGALNSVTTFKGSINTSSINKVIITQPQTKATLNLADNSSLNTQGSFNLTLVTTQDTTVALPVAASTNTITLVDTRASQLLSNKVFDTTNRFRGFVIQDPTVNSKQVQFSITSITAGQTRTISIPNITSTMAVLGLAQTFSQSQTFNNGFTSYGYGASFQTGGLTFGDRIDNITTGADAEVDNSGTNNDYPQVSLRNTSLTSIKGIKLGNSFIIIFFNDTGNALIVKHDQPVSVMASRILCPNNKDVIIPPQGSFTLTFDVDKQACRMWTGSFYKAPGASIQDATGLDDIVAKFNLLLARNRDYGVIQA